VRIGKIGKSSGRRPAQNSKIRIRYKCDIKKKNDVFRLERSILLRRGEDKIDSNTSRYVL